MNSLREIIKAAGGSMDSQTVMSAKTDPYRMDTPGHHQDAKWLADLLPQFNLNEIHNRGLHYRLVSLPGLVKPNGDPYLNNDDDWTDLQDISSWARWLGYIPFEFITDERNAGPELWVPPTIEDPGIQIVHNANWLSDAPDMPCVSVNCQSPHVRQAYKLVLIGEKSSLRSVLQPICQKYEAELVLPTGELSTTLLHGIAKRAADDGRPCKIFYLSDFDPSGLHMPVEVSRKLQALCDLKYPGLDIELHRCALTVDQVRELGLPETPMKDTEKRADRWRERFNCEQTEIDALAVLQAGTLAAIVENDLKPYFDNTLQNRVRLAYQAAAAEIRGQIDGAMEPFESEIEKAQSLINHAAEKLAVAHEFSMPLFDEIADSIDYIEPESVKPEYCADFFRVPLFSSMDDFSTTTANLREAKL